MQKNKRLLIVSYSFPPANSPAAKRVYYFAKYLPQSGIQPTILTAEKQISSLGYDSCLSLEEIDFVRTPKQATSNTTTSKQVVKSSFLSNILRHFLFPDRGVIWLPKGLRDGYHFLRNNPDVEYIFASAPSFVNFIIALLLQFIFKKKLILDFRDFYFTEGLFKRVIPLNLFDFLLESIAVKKANHLLFISNGMMRTYQKAYPKIASKSSLIYNGVDIETVPAIKYTRTPSDKIILFYAGSFYFNSSHPRNIFLILDSLLSLLQRNLIPDFEIHIAANLTGNEQELFNQPRYLKHIILLGLLSQEEVQNYYAKANACLLLLGNSKQDQSALPIKAFEYLYTGRAILALTPNDAEVEELFNGHGQFIACKYENSSSQNEELILRWFELLSKGNTQKMDEQRFLPFDRKYQALQLGGIISKL